MLRSVFFLNLCGRSYIYICIYVFLTSFDIFKNIHPEYHDISNQKNDFAFTDGGNYGQLLDIKADYNKEIWLFLHVYLFFIRVNSNI